MASSLALRRVAAASSVLSRLTNPLRAASIAPNVTRPFNTSSQMRRYDDDDESVVDVERRTNSPFSSVIDLGPYSDVFDPIWPASRSLSKVLNLMDQLAENPFFAASRGVGATGSRRGWDVKEDDNALSLRMDMPGLSKKDVKVSVEQNILTIKGEAEKESGEEESGRRYSSRLDLPPNLYKLGEIKAEMKNGVLKVVVPKVKEDEKKDVFQVTIE
ncbi:small heat shock protein, chloroplastic-like [Rhodamnia argentea]|uniref:Small heat shock protein, chloroplastic-like n=1 Tax=Rhodamnia argentea TaxID=178133 RepID=A0A8B8NQL7_9MYRT|nr:small heat shock protein, chloroplastic-like [Rhodamnia argentea]XP_048140947.1 small heat shock protein, chloroplastic-like [Rhodamnia argentea]